MDKETLSNYGWIVICVLVLAVMIALATPFGDFIANGVKSTTQGLFDASHIAINEAGVPGLTIEDQSLSKKSEINPSHNNTIPEGAKYIKTIELKRCNDCGYVFGEEESTCWCIAEYGGTPKTDKSIYEIYDAGDNFPEIQRGDMYYYGDYEYCYGYQWCGEGMWSNICGCNNGGIQIDGWGVMVCNRTKTEYGIILENINGHNIVDMYWTFNGTDITKAPAIPHTVTNMNRTFLYCMKLTVAPIIPDGVTNLNSTFEGCEKLITAPSIPQSVKSMRDTFMDCWGLTGSIEINANPEVYDGCFISVSFNYQKINLTGSSIMLDEIGQTGRQYCNEHNGYCNYCWNCNTYDCKYKCIECNVPCSTRCEHWCDICYSVCKKPCEICNECMYGCGHLCYICNGICKNPCPECGLAEENCNHWCWGCRKSYNYTDNMCRNCYHFEDHCTC